MGLPLLYKRPDDDESWRAWSFNHAAIHYAIIGAISAQKSQNLTQYMLDPMDPNNIGMWLYQHQVMHNQANAVLGTTGYNLVNLDWTDSQQFDSWLQQNADEHTAWGGILGVG